MDINGKKISKQKRPNSPPCQMPATACFFGHFWLWSSDLWAAPQMKHLTELMLSVHILDVLLCPREWQHEDWMRSGFSTHFCTVTSFPNIAMHLARSTSVAHPSGSEIAKVTVVYRVDILSRGFSHHGGIEKVAFFRPSSDLTSLRRSPASKGLPSLSVKGTPWARRQVHPIDGHS